MELLYIWLGKSKINNPVFEKQGFKFTGEYDFSYDEEKLELNIKHNDEYDTNFYKLKDDLEAKVKLSCIVGKNGAGKTCLLELLQSICNENCLTSFKLDNYEQFLILWKDEDNDTSYKEYCTGKFKVEYPNYTQSKNEKYHVLLKNNDKKNQLLCDFSNNKLIKERIVKDLTKYYEDRKVAIPNSTNNVILEFADNYSNWAKTRDNIYLINYSNNVFDDYREIEYTDLIKYFDISSIYYVYNDNKREIEQYQEKHTNKILSYRLKELQRKVYFYFNKDNQEFLKNYFNNHNLNRSHFIISSCDCDINVLKDLYSNYSDVKYFIDNTDSFITNKVRECIRNSEDIITKLITKQKWFLAREIIHQFLHSFKPDFDGNFINSKISLNTSGNSPEEFVEQNLTLFNNKYKYKNLGKDIVDLISYSNTFFGLIDKLYKYVDDNHKYDLYIKCDDKDTVNIINEIIEIYKKMRSVLYSADFASFSLYPRFSSGEGGLITLLSRFYYLVKYDKHFLDNSNKIKNITILIDEGETGFHPEWSKEYLYAVLTNIQELFVPYKNIKNIHFIITTNDPIILSDVLPNDIIYLENMEILNKDISSFGSNILDLYSDNFFISDGLIGQYAKEKISYVLECIEESKPNDECLFIIENIGDENIKNYLFNLYDNKIRKV